MTFRIRAAVGGILASLAAVLVLSACGGTSSGSNASSGDPLVVYSGRSEEYVGPALDAFSKASGVALDVRYGDSVDLALLIGEEGDRTPAGVFLSQSPGSTVYLGQKGLLSTLPAATLDRVPPRFRAKDGTWVGVTGRQRVVVYNTDLIKPADLPASVFDLTKPQYQGKVGVAPSNASFQDFVTAMSQLSGAKATQDWLTGMAGNGAKVYAKNDAIAQAVAQGQVAMGLLNHYYPNEILKKDPAAHIAVYRFPATDPGSLFLVSTAAIPTAAGKDPRAVQLLDFMLSPKGQAIFVAGEGEYPVVAGVKQKAGQPSLAELKYPSYDLSQLADLKQTAQMIRESGLGG